MKNFFKIAGLYLLFGAVVAFLITAFGGYHNTVVNPTMVALTMVQYCIAMLGVAIFWMPALVLFFFSKTNYFSFEHPRVIIAAVFTVFILLSVLITKKRKVKQWQPSKK